MTQKQYERDNQKRRQSDESYQQGYQTALMDVKHELNFCAANGYKFPILHILKFIDTKLKEKTTT